MAGIVKNSVMNDDIVVESVYTPKFEYTYNNMYTTNVWSTMGAQLANPQYKIVSVKNQKPSRPYFRLKIHIGKISPFYAKKVEELEGEDVAIYNKYKNDENWVRSHLIQLYKNSIRKNNAVLDRYKNGERVYFDAGFDLYSPINCSVNSDVDVYKLDHFIQCSMEKVEHTEDGKEVSNPVGYYLYPRSSMGTKTPLSLANSVGIIDSGYRGNIIAVLHCTRNSMVSPDGSLRYPPDYNITRSQRLVQLCPPDLSYPMEVVLVGCEADLGGGGARGKGGFGSTGD